MNITKLYYTPKELVEEVKKITSKIILSEDEFLMPISVEAIRLHCKEPKYFNWKEIDHIKKGNRYLITKKGLEQAIEYHSKKHIHYSPFDNLISEKPKTKRKYKLKRVK